MAFRTNEIVYSRFFPGKALIVVFCDNCIAVLREEGGNGTFALPVGELTR